MTRTQGGEWLVRIEDIDTPRVVPGAAGLILRTLESFGLYWDGPVVYQSRRLVRYQQALQALLDAGCAYPCSCSRQDVSRTAAPGAGGVIYPGTCRQGPQRPERPTAIRLRTEQPTIAFQDRIQGAYGQSLETAVGDFIIRRADGLFAYQLAVVVDDAAQGVTQVVRGCDLLDSTPRQTLSATPAGAAHAGLQPSAGGGGPLWLQAQQADLCGPVELAAARPDAGGGLALPGPGAATGTGRRAGGGNLVLGLRSLAARTDPPGAGYRLGAGAQSCPTWLIAPPAPVLL